MKFLEDVVKIIPEAAGELYVLAAIVVVVVAWLIYAIRKQRSRDFISAGELLTPDERLIFYRKSGYTYDDLSTLTREQRLSVITKKYRLLAYIATLIFLIFGLFSISENLNQYNSLKADKKISEAETLYGRGRFGEAYVAYKEADTLSSGKNYDAKYGAARSLIRQSDFDRALPIIYRGISELEEGDFFLKSKFLALHALHLKNSGSTDKALETFHEAEQTLGDCEDRECMMHLAVIYGNIGIIYGNMCRYEDSEIYLRKAIEKDEAAGDREGYLADSDNLATLYTLTGKYEGAVEILNVSLQEWVSLERHHKVAYAKFKLGKAVKNINLEAAYVHYKEALRYIDEHGVDDERLVARINGDYSIMLTKTSSNLDQARIKAAKSLAANMVGDDKSGISVQLSTLFYLYEKDENIKCANVSALSSINLIQRKSSDYICLSDIRTSYLAFVKDNQELVEPTYGDFIETLAECTDIAQEAWYGIFTTLPKIVID